MMNNESVASEFPAPVGSEFEDEPGAELVVVSVGTDHHPFERLAQWTANWATTRSTAKVVLQRGSAGAPAGLESHELIPHDELRALFRSAHAVVSHGGPSTVMDARMAGKLPIVVPRDPSLGEHVDDHQLRFAEHLSVHGLARLVKTEAEFVTALNEVLADPNAYSIAAVDVAASAGVVRFGEVVDELLGIETTLTADQLP